MKRYIGRNGDVGALSDKIILVTGATDGIGRETARELAMMEATVIVHGRNAARVESAIEELPRSAGSSKLETAVADFSSLKQVRQLAGRIAGRFPRVDVLINNAGVFMRNRVLSEDGFEMTFAVNHLAHFLLTNLLLPLLKKGTAARIITVSSAVHSSAALDFENLNAEKHFDAHGAYALSKLANILFSKELAVRLEGSGITSNALHPGVINTKMLREAFNMSGASVKEGAATSVYLASSPAVEGVTGKYFIHKREARAAPIADNASLRERFWNASASFVGL
jgi:NAD(P)-dependent dehydrogenase (short-subunit alcohol dehydrogenase family)